MTIIKPQILAAISGAIAAYMADEEACQAAAAAGGRGPGPALQPLGPGRPSGGHAAAAVDAAPEFEVMQLSAVSSQLSANGPSIVTNAANALGKEDCGISPYRKRINQC